MAAAFLTHSPPRAGPLTRPLQHSDDDLQAEMLQLRAEVDRLAASAAARIHVLEEETRRMAGQLEELSSRLLNSATPPIPESHLAFLYDESPKRPRVADDDAADAAEDAAAAEDAVAAVAAAAEDAAAAALPPPPALLHVPTALYAEPQDALLAFRRHLEANRLHGPPKSIFSLARHLRLLFGSGFGAVPDGARGLQVLLRATTDDQVWLDNALTLLSYDGTPPVDDLYKLASMFRLWDKDENPNAVMKSRVQTMLILMAVICGANVLISKQSRFALAKLKQLFEGTSAADKSCDSCVFTAKDGYSTRLTFNTMGYEVFDVVIALEDSPNVAQLKCRLCPMPGSVMIFKQQQQQQQQDSTSVLEGNLCVIKCT